jgi:hypothetical protein
LNGVGCAARRLGGPEGAPVLAYGGLRNSEWNAKVSVPVTDYNSASFSYTDATASTRGYMLLFGTDHRLEIVRYGLLADLRRTYARRRPASVEEEQP